MGECVFYMKAKFPSKRILTKVFPEIEKFIKQGQEAENWWQEHRNWWQEHRTEGPAKFWPAFETLYPLVAKYLKHAGLFGKDYNNDLAGELAFGTGGCDTNGSILYWAEEVWHLASWENLTNYIQSEYGATKIVWNTEEGGCGSIDSLMLYDYEEIVERILKYKELLPTLLSIHPDLDVLIEEKLK